MLWLVFIFLTCIAVLAVLLPLAMGRPGRNLPPSESAQYRNALSDIKQYLERGLLDKRDADVMRAEAARRLLAQEAERRGSIGNSSFARTAAAALACIFIPVFAISAYLHLGRYNIPDHPLAERIALIPGHKDTSKRIEELERLIKRHPRDGGAYEMIAPFYQRERRFEDAVHALEEALRLRGADSNRYATLGEARVVANQGEVPPEAVKDFQAALKINSKEILARYYLGVAAAQAGEKDRAEEIWNGLLSDAPKGADWAMQVEADLQELRSSRR